MATGRLRSSVDSVGMTDAIDLTKELRTTLSDLLRRFLPGVAVWAYGSRVKWTARPNSDLDLVVFASPAQRSQVADLKEALAESNLPFPVDLHVWEEVPERFREIIRKEHVVVQEAKEPESGSGIADGWNSCTIGDLCDAGIVELQTGPFGTQLHAHDYVENGVPVVPTEAIRNRQIDHSVLPKISSGKAEELARHRLEQGDILFARRGVQATGHIGCVREAEEGFLCGTGAIRLRVKKGDGSVNPDFLSHVLANPASVEWFKFHAIGATMPNLNEGIIRSFPLQIPPLPEQRAIAHIFGTLDDKIELNRKMNETLETMARALFKSWFVDFDPVRAKAEGRDPGLPQLLAGLFPDSFEDSELGEIPRGWEVGSLGRFFKVGLGGAWGEDDASDRSTVSVRCLRGIDCHELAEGYLPDVPIRWVSPKQAADRQLSDGTVLVEGSGSFCGRSMIWSGAYERVLGGPIGYSNFCKRLDPVCGASQAVICWMQMRQAYRDGVLQSFRTGTAFPNFDVNGALGNLIVVVPPILLADAYARFFQVSQRLDLMAQSRTLAALRDTLLPKLISGELRVNNLEKKVRAEA